MNLIAERIKSLRQQMAAEGISAFIVPSTDPHSGEYVPAHWESRKWISGFTGSAGTAVITLSDGGLWTDSRYFLQAADQLQGSGLTLFKDRLPETPSIAEWLGSVLKTGDKVGIDGWVNSISEAMQLKKALQSYGLELVTVDDPFHTLWKDRPSLPLDPPFILPLEYSGEPCKQKIGRIRKVLQEEGAKGLLISALDEIAWVLNMRGTDVHCNPVFVGYLLITADAATLYIHPDKLTAETRSYLTENQIQAKGYSQVAQDLEEYKEENLQLSGSTNYALYQAASLHSKVLLHDSPVLYMKAIKNETEIAGFHQAMLRDGVAMVNFLCWLEEAVKSGKETEITIDRKLYAFRAAQKDFKGISFDTIAGYQAHGAIVHYEATEETAATLQPEGFLLLDSGAQYLDGTTDITRTISLGPVTEDQKKDYTLILKGFIQLSMAHFPYGTCGTQLDVLARQFIWKAGMNYGHGTGHGVGHFLNVHEGPHQFRMNHMPALLLPGMTVTNEPGVYKAGRYGVRTENTMLIVKDQTTEFGEFYKFEPLTLCPIDLKPLLPELLSPEEKEWLNSYHQQVYTSLSPFLSQEQKEWLAKATMAVR
ncbi:MAG TPA: aminopeptidase P family protein [Bacteroides mediterraneensis]|uniref:aminopeptidase P family protein n=1 Tax=Bacteroides mediterraneensis TaxID=1841856 RepID=UPI0026E94E02|nr:aminopeptidase P family protein [Bacteroides mediterraneensis]HJH66454.1 aminopeptidase P family protein [Bacteroides mediterraneensis]